MNLLLPAKEKKQNCFVLGTDEVDLRRVLKLNNVGHKSIHDHITCRIILAFWLVFIYDQLKDRRRDDDTTKFYLFIFLIL